MQEVRFTAVGSGYFIVRVNGVQVSQHSDEREACERIANIKLARPSDEVEFRHDYTVRATLVNAPVSIGSDTLIESSTGVMGSS